jgi:hypothetical protein
MCEHVFAFGLKNERSRWRRLFCDARHVFE